MSKEPREPIPPMEGISEDASRNTLALNPLEIYIDLYR